jgi:hypothetical protein
MKDEVVIQNEGERYEIYEVKEGIDYSLNYQGAFKCSNGWLIVDTKDDKNIFYYSNFFKDQENIYQGKFVDFGFFTQKFLFLVFLIYCIFTSIPIILKIASKVFLFIF